jgi:hypothetical protein
MPGLRLDDGKAEQVLAWTETVNGTVIWLRIRPDWYSNDRARMLDYKTSTDSEPTFFTRQMARMGYHFQDAFYRRGARAVTGIEPQFVLAAQEKEKPYAVTFHGCAPSLAAIADDMVEMAIQSWASCMASGKWPGYSPRIHYAEAASWQLAEHEERMIGIPYRVEDLHERKRA